MPDETPFRLEEATIDELHAAIKAGRTTCVAVVRHYIARARAYNGVCSVLVTEDGASVPETTGAVRAGSPLPFPTETVKASTIFPDLDHYRGLPLEFGRMEPTASDPSVQQQYGMIAGVPNAGQLNALATLNIRGERSVTCRGDFDRHPSEGPLAPGAPPICEHFRQLPDALERAAELDALYGRNPDLEKMPMHGVVFSFKDPFDTKDMRTTAGGDAAYDIDFPARDHVLVEQLRNKGAIIFAKAVCTEYNGRAGDPGGRHKPEKVLPSVLGYQRSSWGGNPSNPYDTTRAASLGSSSGSGVSVSANLVMVSLGEETRASTRGPANHNAVALILPHKAMLSFNGGAIGADIYCDRSGILARTIGDAAKVLDALKDPKPGITTRATPTRPCRAPRCWRKATRSMPEPSATLTGMRIGVIRKSMLRPPRRQGRRADRHRRRSRDQGDPRRQARRHSGRKLRPALGTGPRSRADEPRLPARSRTAGAGLHARSAVPVGPGRAAGLQGIRGGDPADRVPAGQDLRQRQDGADRLLRGAWPKGGSRRPPTSTSPRSRSRSWRCRSASMSTSTCRAAPPIGASAASPKGSPISPRSTRAPNSGAMTVAPGSGTGRRSPIRATRWAGARASTSGSCCANCCAGST